MNSFAGAGRVASTYIDCQIFQCDKRRQRSVPISDIDGIIPPTIRNGGRSFSLTDQTNVSLSRGKNETGCAETTWAGGRVCTERGRATTRIFCVGDRGLKINSINVVTGEGGW